MNADTALRVTTFQNNVTMVTFLDVTITNDPHIDRIGDHLLQLAEERMRTCILNLRNLQYVSSALYQKLITLKKRLAEQSGTLVLCCVNSGVQETLEITKLDRFFVVAHDEVDAFLITS